MEKKPIIIQCPVIMEDANAPIGIYEGDFILKGTNMEATIRGEIFYRWLPSSGARFKGIASRGGDIILEMFNHSDLVELIVDGLVFGKGFLSRIAGFSLGNDVAEIEGVMSQRAVFGDASVAVEKIRFCVPNMRDFYGRLVATEDQKTSASNRMSMEDHRYIIHLDKDIDYAVGEKLLKEKGGFFILASGELIPKNGQIGLEESKDILHSFGEFLTFYCGRRTRPIFYHGIFKEQILWCDYSNYASDMFKPGTSWSSHESTFRIDELWKAFSRLWQDEGNKDFLITLVQWYVESNGNRSSCEGSIVLAQNGLELLYNWWIVENKRIILGKDTENINASNKIRLLISSLNLTNEVPDGCQNLKDFVRSNDDIIDAPDAVVQVRNAIVHSQQEKRKRLNSMHYKVKYECLQVCLWYMELALLKILEYEGKYYNRCSNSRIASDEEPVPWAIKK